MKKEKVTIKPYSGEWIKAAQRSRWFHNATMVLCVVLMLGLFAVDGTKTFNAAVAQFKIMGRQEATELLNTFESEYFGQYVFNYEAYDTMREDFLKAQFISYYDYYDFLSEVAEMANDYYSSFIFNTAEVPYYDNYIMKLDGGKLEKDIRKIAENEVAYLQVETLNAKSISAVKAELVRLNSAEVDYIILDFTKSPLGQNIHVATFLDFFISDQQLFSYQTKEGIEHSYIAQTGAYRFEKIFIFINSDVSGPGEIITASLKRALGEKVAIIGDQAYGIPYVFEYRIEKAHGYIFKYALGPWRIDGVDGITIEWPLDFKAPNNTVEQGLMWIESYLNKSGAH